MKVFVIITLLFIVGGVINVSERLKEIEVHLRVIKDLITNKD